MKFKYLASICIASSFYWNINAQDIATQKYQPYAPVDFPTGAPEWMHKMVENPESVNFYEIQKKYQDFVNKNPDIKRKESPLKAVRKYYQRWYNTYENYVTADGSIKLPYASSIEKEISSLNAAAKEKSKIDKLSKNNLAWKVISPLITRDFQTKKISPAQSNIQRFDVSKSNPNILYCGTETAMVFKSVDKGENWTPCTPNHYFGGEISSIEIAANNPDKLVVTAGTKIWLSTNGGDSWEDISAKSFRNYTKVRDLVIDPLNDNHFFMGDDGGFYETFDNGKNWRLVARGQCMDIKYNPKNPQILYTLQKRKNSFLGFYRSENGGKSFVEKAFPDNLQLISARMGLHTTDAGQEYIYLLASKNYFGQRPFYIGTPYLVKSTDAGNNWTVQDISKKVESPDKNGGQGYYDMVMHVSPKDPEHILFGLTHLYKSKDGGATLQNLGGYYGKYDIHADMQEMHTRGDETWLCTDGGVNYSNDFFDSHVEPKIRGIYASELWGFAQGWNEDIIAGGRNHNGDMVQMDSYNGTTISLRGSEHSTGYIFMSNERKTAFIDVNGNIIVPKDWKDAFVPFGELTRFPMESTQYGLGFEFDPRYAKSFLILQGYGDDELRTLWKTTDDGNSFIPLYKFDRPISAHTISRSNPDKIVVATMDNIYYSTDAGKTFIPFQNLPEGILAGIKHTVAIHPRDENEIWISSRTEGNIFRTKDNGATWEKLDTGLQMQNADGGTSTYFVGRFFLTGNEKNAAYAIANVSKVFDPNIGSSFFTGKIIYRDDETNSWVDISEGLPPVIRINRMLPFYKDGKIRIATNNGVWERPLNDADFKPVAQPMVSDIGVGNPVTANEVQFESFSIVNQKNAQWKWSFNPPVHKISDENARNPKVTFNQKGYYDVTLSVTTPKGTDTKTVKKMIYWDGKSLSVANNAETTKDISLVPSYLQTGTPLKLMHKNLNGSTQVQIFDTTGRLVYHKSHTAKDSENISLPTLASGIYFYTLVHPEFRKSGKFIVK